MAIIANIRRHRICFGCVFYDRFDHILGPITFSFSADAVRRDMRGMDGYPMVKRHRDGTA
jgi:hypothetical protein